MTAAERRDRVLAKLRDFVRQSRPAAETAAADRDDRHSRAAASPDASSPGSARGTLDVGRAIEELSRAGLPAFAALALNLAVRTDRHEAAVGLWVGPLADAATALRYLGGLCHSAAERTVLRWGGRLLAALPGDATDVMVRLCTGWRPDVDAAAEAARAALDGDEADAGAWAVRAAAAVRDEASLTAQAGGGSAVLTDVDRFLPLFGSSPVTAAARPDAASGPRRLLLASAHLRRLLLAVADSYAAPPLAAPTSLTLLELCLRPGVGDPSQDSLVPVDGSAVPADDEGSQLCRWTGAGCVGAGRARRVARLVMASVLERPDRCPLDEEAALLLCRRYGFEEGSLRLMGREGASGARAALERHASLLAVAVSEGRWDDAATARQSLVDHSAAHQGTLPELWGEALAAVVACFVGRAGEAGDEEDDEEDDEDGEEGGVRVRLPPGASLSRADAEAEEESVQHCAEAAAHVGGMPPLQVIQTLARNRRVPLRVVKPMLERSLGESERRSVAAERATRAHRAETEVMRTELRRLRGPGLVLSEGRSRASGAPLEAPSVHFLCGRVLGGTRTTADRDQEHSFQRDEATSFDGELYCPTCHPDHAHVLELRRQVRSAATNPERFFAQLDEPEERGGQFAAVAEFLGKGVVERMPLPEQ